jgi:hypothetical protein
LDLPSRKLKAHWRATVNRGPVKESNSKQRTRESMGTVYRIVVRGELSQRFAPAFEGMEMKTRAGQTVLTGHVPDQTRLHGILDRINSLGLTLVSVNSLIDEPQASESVGKVHANDEDQAP